MIISCNIVRQKYFKIGLNRVLSVKMFTYERLYLIRKGYSAYTSVVYLIPLKSGRKAYGYAKIEKCIRFGL